MKKFNQHMFIRDFDEEMPEKLQIMFAKQSEINNLVLPTYADINYLYLSSH